VQIYFDMRCLQDPLYARRGIGYHSAGILRHARNRFPKAELVGIVDESLAELHEERRDLVDRMQHRRSPIPNGDVDVFVQLSPMTHDPSVMAPLLGRTRVLTATVIYDFIQLAEPDRYLPTPGKHRAFVNRLAWLKLYDLYCPISEFSGRELQDILGVRQAAIHVTGACVRDVFTDFNSSRDNLAGPECSFGPGEYFLFVGGEDSRKNAECVVKAHAEFVRRTNTKIGLVAVGGYSNRSREDLVRLFRSHGGGPGGLEFARAVSDEELASLYHHAVATACPSRIEGFSLPVAEAIACGCPVLASNCASQKELIRQDDALFEPDDYQRLSRLMESVAKGKGTRENLYGRQEEIARRFSEEKVAERFWEPIVAAWKDRTRRQPYRVRSGKPRLAFLTPYPPDRSGVAEYSAESFRSLARYAEIDVFTDAKTGGADTAVRQFCQLSEFPYVVDGYDRVISIVGNSHFHTRIIEYHCRYGGACVEHDNRLAELYAWWRGPEAFAEMASRSLRRPVTIEESCSWLANPGQLPCLFFDEILAKAEPLIVHSRGIQRNLKERYGFKAAYLPFCCHRQFADTDLSEGARAGARMRLGLPGDRITMITLGIAAPVKGSTECIWALEQLLAWGIKAELHFVGPSDQEHRQPLIDLCRRLKLEDHVHFSDDWVSDQTYRDFLVAADYAIQLRTHGFGGLSGAVMDCISAGLPTVVNEDLAHAVEAPGYVLSVPDNLSPTLIAEQLCNAIGSDLHRRRVRPERKEYLSVHNFEEYAPRMMEVLGLA